MVLDRWRGLFSLPVARHAKRGLIWVKPTLNSFQGLFWLEWPQTWPGLANPADRGGFAAH
jgi:hypothetical protein